MTQPDTAALKRTPLHAAHVRLGARMIGFGGRDMPVQYESAKGDFVGKAAIERVRAEGPKRRLVGFEMVDRAVARHRSRSRSGDGPRRRAWPGPPSTPRG